MEETKLYTVHITHNTKDNKNKSNGNRDRGIQRTKEARERRETGEREARERRLRGEREATERRERGEREARERRESQHSPNSPFKTHQRNTASSMCLRFIFFSTSETSKAFPFSAVPPGEQRLLDEGLRTRGPDRQPFYFLRALYVSIPVYISTTS